MQKSQVCITSFAVAEVFMKNARRHLFLKLPVYSRIIVTLCHCRLFSGVWGRGLQ